MKSKLLTLLCSFFLMFAFHQAYAQLKQVYKDSNEDNEVRKFCFYSKTEGYIAFRDWIGYTIDGGATFQKKRITLTNVNFNGFSVNLTFGFAISGVKAFDKNNLIIYGDYGLVPAILTSADGGETYKIVYHQQSSDTKFSYMIDMVFPDNGNIGYAIDEDRILKTTNKGQTWVSIYLSTGSYYKQIEASGTFVAAVGAREVIRSTNSGVSFAKLKLPTGFNGIIKSATHLSSAKVWLNLEDYGGYLYSSADGGNTWDLKNNAQYDPLYFTKIKFFDDNLGYAIGPDYIIYKTSNGGKNWEQLPRDNNFSYLSYTHYDAQFWDKDNFWVGGGYGFIESTTNGGGVPILRPVFGIDLSTLSTTNTVRLLNFSKSDYSFKWLLNDVVIATSYDVNFQRDNFNLKNKITLVVTSGIQTASLTKEILLQQGVQIMDFSPKDAGLNSIVTITGINFTGASKVTFGGTNASSFTVVSPTTITAKVGAGKSGEVYVAGPSGFSVMAGFNYLPPPTITSFAPTSATKGRTVTINGSNFINVTAVTFGGVPVMSYSVVSPTRIDAVVGVGESGSVAVTSLGGTIALPGFNMLPTIESFTPTSGTNGEIVVIKGAGFLGATAVSIGNTAVKSFTVINTTMISAVVGASSSGSVIVTTKNGTHSLPGFTFYNPPKINDFSPRFSTSGGSITITGSNFSNDINGNIVLFGDIKGKVINATATALTVEVPAISTFKPLSVTTNSLTADGKTPFVKTLSSENSISSESFADKIDLPIIGKPSDFKLYDFDGDGFLDIVLLIKGSINTNEVAFYRNKGIAGEVKFDEKTSLFFQSSEIIFSAKDMDGDGKPDMVICDRYVYPGVFIYQNTSSPGKISFLASPNVLSSVNNPYFGFRDIDGDGKPDFVTGGLIRKNTSSPGNISFANYDEIFGPIVEIADFDDDGKLDMITYDSSSTLNKLDVYKNESTLDKISFTKVLEIPTSRPSEFVAADIDGDRKIDLVTISNNLNELNVYKNTGNNSFAFATPLKYPVGSRPTSLSIHDLDGDGLIDVLFYSEVDKSASVLKNISSTGSPKLAQKVMFATLSNVKTISAGDIDQDGKPDIVFQSEGNAKISYLKNKVNKSPFLVSFTPSIAKKGDVVVITGTNFTGVSTVNLGGLPVAKFIIDSPTQITATVGDGASGSVTIANSFGSSTLPGFSYGLPPIISSFFPVKANAGTSIVISGKNFSENISENKVLFGLAYGTVTAATSTTLTVTVPSKATYAPISVTSNGLIGSSINSFVLTFAGDQSGFTEKSFAPAIRPHSTYKKGTVADLDGDGQMDFIYSLNNFNDKSLHIYRAGKKNGQTIYDAPLVIPMINQAETSLVTDIDGDGKMDLVVYSYYQFHVFKNTSVPGKISLTQLDFAVDGENDHSLSDIKVGDVDNDGKTDVVISYYSNKKISIFRNESSAGTIKFGQQVDLLAQGWVPKLILQDFNGDGKIDLAYTSNSSHQAVILKNTSQGGQISFDAPLIFQIATAGSDLVAGDIDGDGKAELLVASNSILAFRNTSTLSTISFAPAIEVLKETEAISVVNLADLDGDGKPDIFRAIGAVAVLKNTSQPGNISFAEGVKYAQPHTPILGITADIDEDGKPDIITFSEFSSSAVLSSKQITKPVLSYMSSTSGAQGKIITLTGFNFNSVTGVSFGGVQASSFKIESSTVITAVVGLGDSGPVTLTSDEGSFDYLQFKFTPPPIITSFSPMVAEIGETVTIKGKYFTETFKVWFSVSFPFTLVDDNTITVKLPASEFLRSGEITVQTTYGTASLPGFVLAKAPGISVDKNSPYYLGTVLKLTANTESSFIHEWRKNGVIIPGATSNVLTVSEAGSYTVAIKHKEKWLVSQPFLFNVLNTLPQTNFKIKATNETCRSSNNGSIEINATANMNYTAIVSGPSFNKTLNFTSNLQVGSLQAANYTICITAAGYPDFKQCFEVVVTEPKDITLFSSIVNADQTVTLNLDGASTYHIELNGKNYTTSNNDITLPLRTGSNSLMITSDLACQGVIKKSITLASGIMPYPNPFEQILKVQIGSEFHQRVVKVYVYDLNGRQVYSKAHTIENMEISLDLSTLTSGIYMLKIESENLVRQSKIIKK
ncbi:FG-GAP-like repeat-containing protein [Pedobacter frigiditerrae]|uniref:FG-GAP-like repeat-containing protein n=1 Tax=Pedobacter frigiditerrae TaxID=2530452 RepID=UPI00292F5521|nr:FG-GAP-like repeat-containing protein [Pedobacter frigiditerrae]